MKKINERLKAIRKDRGLKQAEMAKMLHLGVSAYSKIETGVNKLSVKHLLIIKREFQVSIDWLLFGESANDTKAFDNNEEDVKKMLTDMKRSKTLLYSILSHYYGLCDKEQAITENKTNSKQD